MLSDVAEGRVTVDGIDRGPLPLEPFALNAGRHAVRLVNGSLHLAVDVDVVPGIVVDAVLLTGRAPGR